MNAPQLARLMEEDLEALIRCNKIIKRHAKKEFETQYAYERNDMELESAPNAFSSVQRFGVFIRHSLVFQEDFSIGLVWKPDAGPNVTLVRCNGAHGKNRAIPHQRIPHVHQLTMENVRNEQYDPHHVIWENAYGSFEEGLIFFFHYCQVAEWEKDFPQIAEPDLFLE